MLAINRVRDMYLYQSLMPAGAGIPRYEKAAGCWQRSFAVCATPLDSSAVSGFGVCFRRKDEVGSPRARRWWYRG